MKEDSKGFRNYIRIDKTMFVFDFLNIQQNYCILIGCMEKCCVRFVTESGGHREYLYKQRFFVTSNIFLLPVTRYKIKSI